MMIAEQNSIGQVDQHGCLDRLDYKVADDRQLYTNEYIAEHQMQPIISTSNRSEMQVFTQTGEAFGAWGY